MLLQTLTPPFDLAVPAALAVMPVLISGGRMVSELSQLAI